MAQNKPNAASDDGSIRTPAPTKPAPLKDRDFGFGRQNYGTNQFAGRSSDNPGVRTSSPLANDMDDPTLAAVRANGVKKADVYQPANKPTPVPTFGMKVS